MQNIFTTYRSSLLCLLLSFGFSQTAFSQIALLDDISLTDQQRDQQLLKNNFKNQSFLLRTAQDYRIQQIVPYRNIGKNKFGKEFKWDGILIKYNLQDNSKMPYGFNNGNLYPAVGGQHRISIGTKLKWRFIELNLQPEMVTARNLNPPPYYGNQQDGNFWARYYFLIQNNIDYYTRMGKQPISTIFPGQSSLAFNYKKFAFGVSTENQWWGAGTRNSLMMTNNAPGFYHLFLKTNKPIETKWGSIEGKAILGRLESPTTIVPEDSMMRTIWEGGIVRKNLSVRRLEGFTISYQPKWLPNFFIGYSFVSQSYIQNRNLIGKDLGYFDAGRPKQQMGAFVLRFVLPKDHAEFYAELGQPNQAVSPWRFFGDSVKTGFVLGARKLFPLGNKGSYFKLYAEFTQLQLMNPLLVIDNNNPYGEPLRNSWYTSAKIRQGYTHQGKLLGASIGPGSNSQTIGFSFNKGMNKIGFFFERVANNNDFYLYQYYSSAYYNRYYVDLHQGVEAQWQVNQHLLLAASVLKTNTLNYKWIRIEDGSPWDRPAAQSDRDNVLINFSLKYSLYAGR